jgi:hypothetical protein
VALSGELPVDWNERVAALPEYEVLSELRAMKEAVASRISAKGRVS